MYQLEQKKLVFGNFSLNNIFVNDQDQVILGPAKINLICVEYFFNKLDVYDESIYLSPEFLQTFSVNHVSDIYSYGVLAFYLVAGDWPYDQHNSIYKIKLSLTKGPKDCRELNPKVSDKLNYFIMKSLQLDKKLRWDSFRLIIGILEGKESVKFERLSNKVSEDHSFNNDVKKEKQIKFGRYFNRVTNGLGIIALIILFYFGYQTYFSKYSVLIIPNLIDQPLNDVKRALADLGLEEGKISYNFHPTIQEGHVVRFDPPIGRRIKQGRAISIFVSKGRQEIVVPSFIGKTLDEVNFILQSSNIELELMPEEFSTSIETGKVISQIPLPNQYMFDSGKIQLTLSKGVPITLETIDKLNDDFKKIRLLFEFNDQHQQYDFKIEEKINDEIVVLHEGQYFPGDYYEDEFVVHQKSTICVYVNDEKIYDNQNNGLN